MYPTKKLWDICDFEGGSQPPKNQFIFIPCEGYVRFLQIRDFDSNKNITYIPNSKKNRLCNEDDILLGRYWASVGKILINKKWAYNVAVIKTIPNPDILDKKYFYYYLISNEFQWRLTKVAARSAQAGFSKDDIYNFPVITPPLSTQLSIVARLDSAIAEIDEARRQTESALASAREVWESTLELVFAGGGEGWEEKRFDEVCVLQRWYDLPTHERKEWSFALVSSNGITDRIDQYKVLAPWVVTWRSWTIWNVHFIDEDFWPLNTALYIKNFHGNNEKCVFYFLKQFNLGKYSSWAGVPTLNRNNVHCEIVAFPPIPEQSRIVAHLDAVRAKTESLERLYTEKLASLDELRRSILQEAFS